MANLCIFYMLAGIPTLVTCQLLQQLYLLICTIKNNTTIPSQKSHCTNKYNVLSDNGIERDLYFKKYEQPIINKVAKLIKSSDA